MCFILLQVFPPSDVLDPVAFVRGNCQRFFKGPVVFEPFSQSFLLKAVILGCLSQRASFDALMVDRSDILLFRRAQGFLEGPSILDPFLEEIVRNAVIFAHG